MNAGLRVVIAGDSIQQWVEGQGRAAVLSQQGLPRHPRKGWASTAPGDPGARSQGEGRGAGALGRRVRESGSRGEGRKEVGKRKERQEGPARAAAISAAGLVGGAGGAGGGSRAARQQAREVGRASGRRRIKDGHQQLRETATSPHFPGCPPRPGPALMERSSPCSAEAEAAAGTRRGRRRGGAGTRAGEGSGGGGVAAPAA